MTLNDFLDGTYSERILHRPRAGATLASFKAALAADGDMKAQAQSRLNGITENICKRCFVTKVYRDVLRDALST